MVYILKVKSYRSRGGQLHDRRSVRFHSVSQDTNKRIFIAANTAEVVHVYGPSHRAAVAFALHVVHLRRQTRHVVVADPLSACDDYE